MSSHKITIRLDGRGLGQVLLDERPVDCRRAVRVLELVARELEIKLDGAEVEATAPVETKCARHIASLCCPWCCADHEFHKAGTEIVHWGRRTDGVCVVCEAGPGERHTDECPQVRGRDAATMVAAANPDGYSFKFKDSGRPPLDVDAVIRRYTEDILRWNAVSPELLGAHPDMQPSPACTCGTDAAGGGIHSYWCEKR